MWGSRKAYEQLEAVTAKGINVSSSRIDDKEFMKALFPDDYRRLYMRSTTTITFQ